MPLGMVGGVRINGLNKRGVNCLRGVFRKYMLRMKIDIDL